MRVKAVPELKIDIISTRTLKSYLHHLNDSSWQWKIGDKSIETDRQ